MAMLSRLWLVCCSLFLILGSATAQGSRPAGPLPTCSTVITSCGCVINHANTYTVANDLSADQADTPNCIEMAASRSILNLRGFAITGNGHGIGILIRNGADHVVLQGGNEGTRPVRFEDEPCASDPNQSIVTQWNTAIEDDGDDAVIELLSLGGTTEQPVGNTNAGIFLNGANHTVASDFIACNNGVAGAIVKNSSGTSLSNLSAVNNQEIGIWLDTVRDSTIATATAAGNGKFGMWLMRSSRNVVLNANGTSGNGDTGILIGCGIEHCAGNETSDSNRITNSGAPGNTNAGIVIQQHNSNNIITVTHNDGNPDGRDMVDNNTHCGSNIWYNNTGTSNQSCIH